MHRVEPVDGPVSDFVEVILLRRAAIVSDDIQGII